jgi:transketolase
VDGHSVKSLSSCFARLGKNQRPIAVVARTVKGWGVSALRSGNCHGKPLSSAQLPAAVAELVQGRSLLETLSDAACPARVQDTSPPTLRLSRPPTFEAAMERAGFAKALAGGKLATRKAYGAALLALGASDPRVVALDGDVKNSTFTELFGDAYPERFFEGKIAEQNMVSVAVGLAAGGYVPFANSFAKFLARAYDQIELASISRANIKLVGSHSGVSLAADGPSQMSLQDVAYFRSFTRVDDGFGRPACVLFQPADAVAAYRMTLLMAEHDGMCYMRTHRPDVPLLYAPDTSFVVGGCRQLRSGDALTLAASGYMVGVALEAADRLAEAGVSCNVFDAYSFPLAADPILAAARAAGRVILTVEDNYGGGLHAEVAEAAARSANVRVEGMFCRQIPKSAGTAEEELAFVGLSVSDIVARAKLVAAGR